MNPFLTTVKGFCGLVKDIQASDRDVVVAIVGDTGEGKSVLVVRILKELLPRFNPAVNLPFSKNELNTLIETLPEEDGIGIDEAVGLFYSRNFNDDEQVALLKKLDRSRDRRHFIALLIPDFFMLDKALRNGRVRYLIWVDRRVGVGPTGRAHAFIFQKERNVFNKEPWNLTFNEVLLRKGSVNKSPNYLGELEYKALPVEEYALYKRVKALKRRLVEIEEWRIAKIKGAKKKRGLSDREFLAREPNL